MTFNEFLEYLEEHLEGYQVFYKKALVYQNMKNKARKKKPWNEAKIERAVKAMWKSSVQPLYDKIKSAKGNSPKDEWIEYIEQHEIFESVNDSMSELEFE